MSAASRMLVLKPCVGAVGVPIAAVAKSRDAGETPACLSAALIFSLETVRKMTHGFCVAAQSSLSSASHSSSAAWFQDQCRLSANSTSASTPSIFDQSDGAFGSFNASPPVAEFRKRRLLSPIPSAIARLRFNFGRIAV